MRIDYIDAFIIYTLYVSGHCMTAYQMTEFISSIVKNESKKVVKQFIVSRMKRLEKYDLLKSKKLKDGTICYSVNKKNVVSGDSKLVIYDMGKVREFEFNTLIGIRADGTWFFIRI